MIQTLNPATGEVLRRFDPLTPQAVQSKLELASSAARTYARESLEHRRFWMRRLALLLDSDCEELAGLIVTEVGKPISAARAEIAKCAEVCRYYAENAQRILEEEHIPTEHPGSYVRWDPMGVLLAIMPWNFPFWQLFRVVAPALMGGNVVLLKHAPSVPQCALTSEALVRRAGFPRGSLQTLLIETGDVETVLADHRVAAVTLTGSEAAGRAVAAQAGSLVKKCVLELGGSDPFVVLPSANLAAAIRSAVQSRSLNNGQSCIAAKRFVVHAEVYDRFRQGVIEEMGKLTLGDPMLESTELGPLASAEALDRITAQIARAVAAGGKVLAGGKRLETSGFFLEPTVIEEVPRTADVCAEEIFGPVALLFRVGSLDEAVELANDTPFGLGASCWTSDPAEQGTLAREIQAGNVFFNAPVSSDPRLPFGGTKRSGFGRELSAAGMREFLNAKTVVLAKTAGLAKPAAEGSAAVSEVGSRDVPEAVPQIAADRLPELPLTPVPAQQPGAALHPAATHTALAATPPQRAAEHAPENTPRHATELPSGSSSPATQPPSPASSSTVAQAANAAPEPREREFAVILGKLQAAKQANLDAMRTREQKDAGGGRGATGEGMAAHNTGAERTSPGKPDAEAKAPTGSILGLSGLSGRGFPNR